MRNTMEEHLVQKNNANMAPSKIGPSPSELRSQANSFLELTKSEADTRIRHGLVGCAFALSQLAESIERGRAENRQ